MKASLDNSDPGWGWVALPVLTAEVAVRKVPVCGKQTRVWPKEVTLNSSVPHLQLFYKFVIISKDSFQKTTPFDRMNCAEILQTSTLRPPPGSDQDGEV